MYGDCGGGETVVEVHVKSQARATTAYEFWSTAKNGDDSDDGKGGGGGGYGYGYG